MSETQKLANQISQLKEVLKLSENRINTDHIAQLVSRAAERLDLHRDFVTVAVMGATGSGKSSLVNALVGQEAVRAGILRPTTTIPIAVIGESQDSPYPLLNALGITAQISVSEPSCKNLIFIDMPDTDSIFLGNQGEVNRLLGFVDLMIWVVDPQKYADRVLHEKYLRQLKSYAPVMAVVLNRIDEVPREDRPQLLSHIKKVLALDGLRRVPVFATCAKAKEVVQVRDWIAKHRESAVVNRVSGDIDQAAIQMRKLLGKYQPALAAEIDIETLSQELLDAFGVNERQEQIAVNAIDAIREGATTPVTKIAKLCAKYSSKGRYSTGDYADSGDLPISLSRKSLFNLSLSKFLETLGWGLPDSWRLFIAARLAQNKLEMLKLGQERMAELEAEVLRKNKVARRFAASQWAFLAFVIVAIIWFGLGEMNIMQMPYWGPEPAPIAIILLSLVLSILCSSLGRFLASSYAADDLEYYQKKARSAVQELVAEKIIRLYQEELEAFERARDIVDNLGH